MFKFVQVLINNIRWYRVPNLNTLINKRLLEFWGSEEWGRKHSGRRRTSGSIVLGRLICYMIKKSIFFGGMAFFLPIRAFWILFKWLWLAR